MHRKLARYVRENLHQGYSLEQVTARLRQEGWKEDDIEKALELAAQSHVRKSRFVLALAGLLVFVFIGAVMHLFIIAPAFIERPGYEPPILASQKARAPQEAAGQQYIPGLESTAEELPPAPVVVDERVLSEVLVQLGVYKLHANPFTGDPPEMEIYVIDTKETFTAVVQGNDVQVQRAAAPDPDVHVEVTQDAVIELASAPDADAFKSVAQELLAEREQRGFSGIVYAGNTDLLLKGYLAFYNDNRAMIESAEITGGAIAELPLAGSGLAGMFTLVVVLWSALVLRLGLGWRE